MTHRTRSLAVAALAASAGLFTATTSTRADIAGLNTLTGWTYNQTDSSPPPTILASDSIQFTNGPNNRRSLWYNTAQDITSFQASFTYRASIISASAALQGITFALQRNPSGLSALGAGGGGFGYSGMTNSAAVTIETNTGPGLTYNGFYTNGVLGGGSTPTTPVNAFDFHDIAVSITYSGSILSVTMVDGASTFGPHNYFVGNLASTLGGSTAYVGFTAGTFNTLGSGGGASQFISNVRFTSVPAPSIAAMLGVGGLAALRRRRR